jgi:hypothetical protein
VALAIAVSLSDLPPLEDLEEGADGAPNASAEVILHSAVG